MPNSKIYMCSRAGDDIYEVTTVCQTQSQSLTRNCFIPSSQSPGEVRIIKPIFQMKKRAQTAQYLKVLLPIPSPPFPSLALNSIDKLTLLSHWESTGGGHQHSPGQRPYPSPRSRRDLLEIWESREKKHLRSLLEVPSGR